MDDGAGIEIDLRDRLLFAAVSLAADFGEELPVDRAEELVFRSAEPLLAMASVTEFVPILAERRARQAVRAGAGGPTPARAAVPVPRPAVPVPRPAVPASRPAVPAPRPAVPSSGPGVSGSGGPLPWPATPARPTGPPPAPAPPVAPRSEPTAAPGPAPGAPRLAVTEGELTRLRDEVERVRRRVAEWRADLTRR